MSSRRWWCVLCSAALGASQADDRALSLIVSAPLAPSLTTAPVRATTCLGFLLPNATSVVTSAQCAITSQEPYSVVLIGMDHAPLVVTVSSLAINAQYSGEFIDDILKWRYDTATGSLDAPLTQRSASPVVFSHLPELTSPELVRYAIHANANVMTELVAGDTISPSMVFNQSEVSIVATSECEAISGKNLSYTGLLCGKSEWTSLDECCAAAAAAQQTDQLVTVKQQDGVEYAVGFVAASFACSASDNSNLFAITSAVTSVLGECFTDPHFVLLVTSIALLTS